MYTHVFVAGTFDGLHAGHRAVLSRAFAEGEQVTVGITSDEFVKQYKSSAHPYQERKEKVEEWIQEHQYDERSTIIEINDPLEPAASGDFDALVVTEQNATTGEKINARRQEYGLLPLMLLLVPLVPAEDGVPISSTRMRAHEIDGWGKLTLPDHVRAELKLPLGDIVPIQTVLSMVKTRSSPLVTVGDLTTDRMLVNGVVPDLSIIDLHVERIPYKALHEYAFPRDITKVYLKSGPGSISQEATKFLSQWSHHPRKFVLVIHGEDDLLVLPAIVYAPIHTIVLYGQPHQGIVQLVVTEELKEKVRGYLERFTRD